MKATVKKALMILTASAVILGVMFFLGVPIYAEGTDEDYGSAEVREALPENAEEILEKNGITPDNNGVLGFSAGDIFSGIWDMLTDAAGKPLKLFLSLSGVIFLCALAHSLRDGSSGGAAAAFDLAAVLAGAGMLITYMAECLAAAEAALTGGGTFMLTFVPVYAGIIAINGQAATAAVFNSVVLAAAEIMGQLMVIILMPLCTAVLGVSVAGAINPDLKIDRAAEAVKKLVIWGLGLIMTVFAGLLSLQSFVTVSADSVTMKAAKFAVSGAVPIVGGAVSDALSTVKSSLGLMKSSMGTFGIIAGCAVVLPTLISVLLFRLALTLAGAVGGLFGADRLTALIKSGESVMTIILAMLVCFLLLIIITVSVMLVLGGNAAV